MLQQTRVETVIPYFERWMKRFPDVKTLAEAHEQDVLVTWEGLGYYSRARNLHKAAKIVIEQHSGKLPQDPDKLRKLPGIGKYTAGAIASIAFHMDEPALDANIRRVLARLFDVSQPADSISGEKKLWQLAAEQLPKGQASNYNQALMDLGATICSSNKPKCPECPLGTLCQARANGTQEQRPVLKPRKKIPHHVHAAGVILKDGQVLLSKRPSKGLLGGLWEFPNRRVDGIPAEDLESVLETGYRLRVKKLDAMGIVKHAYTHFKVTVHAFRCRLITAPDDHRQKWVRLNEIDKYPMGKVDRQIAKILHEKI